ncbi:hypothetical protein [Pseudomonas sp. NBRC 111124]|uniref:hypothetical protein n=1 Tax=Pseudomonas sp. NBRC 111124 TaxID=1661039 RepID=UPI0007610F0B|nr:hypothetical protein [Pseudomonas sp. NBRC 111124]
MANDDSQVSVGNTEVDPTLGWGAIFGVSKAALDLQLQERFLERYRLQNFPSAFNGTFPIHNGGRQWADFAGLVMGPPTLDFSKTNQLDDWVNVRVELITGDFTVVTRLAGHPPLIESSSNIVRGMGLYLQARVRVSATVERDNGYLAVNVDWSSAEGFTCNLGRTEYAQQVIANALGEWLKTMPVSELLAWDLRGYGAFDPHHVKVLTQPAPWTAETDAEGDGAVLLFMQLGSDVKAGTLPLPSAPLPYWLERGAGPQVAILAADYIDKCGYPPTVAVQALALQNQRQLGWQAKGRSGVTLGTLNDTPATRRVEPAVVTLTAGGTQPFTLKGIAAADWTATNTYLTSANGSIDQAGRYTSRASTEFVKQTQLVLVDGQKPEDQSSGTALVVESLDAIQIYPRLAVWEPGQPAIEMRASGGSGKVLKWKVVGEEWGKFSHAEGAENSFTPHPSDAFIPPVRLQQFEVTDGEVTSSASVVMVVWPASRVVTPHYVRREHTAGPLDFKVSRVPRPGVNLDGYKWQLFGDGHINEDTGHYTPPVASARSCSVVMAINENDFAGYAIIEHGTRTAKSVRPASWIGLEKFYVQATGAGRGYANGLQQIEVLVTIETNVNKGEPDVKVSPEDLNTLRFYAKGGSEIPVIEGDVGFDPPSDSSEPGTWKVNLLHNPRYSMLPGAGVVPGVEPHNEQATVYKRYYLQTTSVLQQEFYAAFVRVADDVSFNSESESDTNGVVKLQGIERPHVSLGAYSVDVTRADQDPNGEVVDNDVFSYMDWTLDHYRLNLVREGLRIPFVSVMLDPDDNPSAVRWESEQFAEGGVSYTSFALGGSDVYKKLTLSGLLQRLNAQRRVDLKDDFKAGQEPALGEFLVCLSRLSNFLYRHPEDSADLYEIPVGLDRPFKFMLVDKEGNRHYLQFNYEVSTSRRNKLLLALQPAVE